MTRLIGLEVGTAGTSLVSHPHPLCLAPLGLGSFHVCQNNDTIKVLTVHIIGGSIEAGTAAENSLSLLIAALLPSVDLALIYLSIEGNHCELCQLCQLIKFSEECREHVIADRAGLVDGDGNLCLALNLLAWVNVGIPLVDPLNTGSTAGSLGGLDEVPEYLLPVYLSL